MEQVALGLEGVVVPRVRRVGALAALRVDSVVGELLSAGRGGRVMQGAAARWWRHAPLQRYFAARWLIEVAITSGRLCWIANLMSWNVLPEVVFVARARPEIVEVLDRAVAGTLGEAFVPATASMLLAAGRAWRPKCGRGINLEGAYLAGAAWAGVDLREARLGGADLSGADLSGAKLVSARSVGVNLSGAVLAGAWVLKANFQSAGLQGANLAGVEGEAVELLHADLTSANLRGARLSGATMTSAVLAGADLTAAMMYSAKVSGAKVEGAVLRSADFSGAVMVGVDFSKAEVSGARFPGANLARCNFENVEMPLADFESAQLVSALLTGSRMARGHFRGASLQHAGLAEIEWPGADLSGANLYKASFHLGSSRSGLVGAALGRPGGSLPASEGSRTGFYTDDRDEQRYRRPEEIRRANLMGADFTGATVLGCDFYLVDVRGAVCSAEQWKHFARTGAIVSEAGGSTR